MSNEDARLDIVRDDKGLIISITYKVLNEGPDGRRALEFCELTSKLLEEETKQMISLRMNQN